jgi:hypothetical protein
MNEEKKPEQKKKQNVLTKITIFLAIIFFSYLGFNYWKSEFAKKVRAQQDVEKFDNIESEIFDLSGEHSVVKDDSLHAENIDDLKEKGAEFIYQLLIKNQTQIADLSKQIQSMQGELIKYKNQEKIVKIILSYVDLRQQIFAKNSYENSLKNFEILTSSDEALSEKARMLRQALPNFSTQKELSDNFSKLIPDLIFAKSNNVDADLSAKIRRNIAKVITIRRIDGKGANIDSVIVETEQFLRKENYQEAMSSLLALNQNYHKIIEDFLNSLSGAIEVQKIDQEIFNHLKSLN